MIPGPPHPYLKQMPKFYQFLFGGFPDIVATMLTRAAPFKASVFLFEILANNSAGQNEAIVLSVCCCRGRVSG